MRTPLGAVVALLVLCGLSGSMQPQHYTFHSYGQSDGLKDLGLRCMVNDRRGFLWIGTEDGLIRFDGPGFEKVRMDTATARGANDEWKITPILMQRMWLSIGC
jgi:ligand-binding sensor domain-containing protein